MKEKIIKIIDNIASRLSFIVNSKIQAKQEAWWMVEEITKKSESELLLEDFVELTPEQSKLLNLWLYQRVDERKPLQYILGYVPFCDLVIKTRPPVLIPRPETEEWTNWLIDLIQKKLSKKAQFKVLDLCSGSGCIALALGKAFPDSYIMGTDISQDAIRLSLENKKSNKIKNVDFVQSDLFGKIQKHNLFDLIVSNPPYLSEEEFEGLSDEVKNWEDEISLVAKHDGYYFYEKIISEAPAFLKVIREEDVKVPQIVFEIGYSQAEHIYNLLKSYKYSNIQVHKDLEGKDRWISANYTYKF